MPKPRKKWEDSIFSFCLFIFLPEKNLELGVAQKWESQKKCQCSGLCLSSHFFVNVGPIDSLVRLRFISLVIERKMVCDK